MVADLVLGCDHLDQFFSSRAFSDQWDAHHLVSQHKHIVWLDFGINNQINFCGSRLNSGMGYGCFLFLNLGALGGKLFTLAIEFRLLCRALGGHLIGQLLALSG